MRGIGPSRGSRASAAGPLRGASVGAAALLLLLGGWFAAPAAAQVSEDDETTTTGGADDTAPDELPTCPSAVGDLELATTLDFADVARALAAEGAAAGPTGDIVGYELYCPYGDLPPSAPSNAEAPLEMLLSWAVVPTPDAPGCFGPDAADAGDANTGVVGDPDRAAQVDWAVDEDEASSADAEAAAEELLASAPSDTVSCDERAADGDDEEGAAATPAADEPATALPLLVIGAALVVCLVAAIVLLVRRRRRGDAPAPAAEPEPAVGPSLVPGPLIAGATAPQRAVRSLPPEVRTSMAAAGELTPRRLEAVVDTARRASSSTVGHHAAAFGLVASAAGTLASADAARAAEHQDEQRRALAAALRTLARGAARSARRAAEVQPGAPSAELDELVRAAQRLVEAHRTLLQPPARTETPR